MKKSTIGKGLLVLGGVAYGAGASADDATVTSVSEDLTVTSSGTLVCSNHTQCLDVTSRNTKITNVDR